MNWTDAVYLSKTRALDANAVLISSYDGNGNRPLLAAGGSQIVPLNFNLPFDETQTAGTYYLIVKTDNKSLITEGAGAVTVASVGPITLTLPALPDLAVSNVQAPDQTIADPATVTISWKVTNIGEGSGRANQWSDEVILTTNNAPGGADDIILGPYVHNGLLAPGGFYNQSATVTLPPAFSGHYHLFVKTDATDKVFEYARRANNVAAKAGFFDVMPVAYADLIVTSVTVPAPAFGGQPLTIQWSVTNQGIGTTSTGDWLDVVYLAQSPDGSNIVLNPATGKPLKPRYEHLGFLAVGGGYQRTAQFPVPDGLSGNLYVVVTTAGGGDNSIDGSGGPFEFIYSANDTTISAAVPVSQPVTPDLVVSSVLAPTTAFEGTPIDITWTVANQGLGEANGSWVDRVYLQDLGSNPANLIGPTIELGQFVRNGPFDPGKTYTRTEQIILPGHIEDLYTVYVTTNYIAAAGDGIYEGQTTDLATLNNTKAAPAPIAVSPQPRPDIQVENIQIPSHVPAGSALSVTFDVINQGTVATDVPHWVDDVYLSLDTTIDPGSLLIGEVANRSALAPGEKYESTTGPLIVPERFRGNVYVIVAADFHHQIDQWPNGNFNEVAKQIFVDPLPLPDLVTSDVILPTQAIAGATIPVTYTVTNLGAGATLVDNWTDTVWLTKTKGRPNPNQGDVLLSSFTHTGALAVKAGYDQTVNIQVPPQLDSGTYYITPWVDPYGVVLQDELAINVNPDDPNQINNDNYKNQSDHHSGRPARLDRHQRAGTGEDQRRQYRHRFLDGEKCGHRRRASSRLGRPCLPVQCAQSQWRPQQAGPQHLLSGRAQAHYPRWPLEAPTRPALRLRCRRRRREVTGS